MYSAECEEWESSLVPKQPQRSKRVSVDVPLMLCIRTESCVPLCPYQALWWLAHPAKSASPSCLIEFQSWLTGTKLEVLQSEILHLLPDLWFKMAPVLFQRVGE